MPKAPTKKTTAPKTAPADKKPKAAKAAEPKVAPKVTVKETPVAEKKAVVKTAIATAKKVKIGDNRPYFYAIGKRKTAIASVRLYKDGTGIITVNGRAFEEYFPVFTDRDTINSALKMANALKTFDISAKVKGGGIHAQADALRHGVSKALLVHDLGLRAVLKSAGYLTRDSRNKERKKYGLHRARRAPQFSKR